MILGVWRQRSMERPPFLHSSADEVMVVPDSGGVAWWQGPTMLDEYGDVFRYASHYVGLSSRVCGNNPVGSSCRIPANWGFV